MSRILGFTLVAVLAVVGWGCIDSPSEPENFDSISLWTCGQVAAALGQELSFIQRCSAASDCGRVLEGTSCGCTRNLVARLDADPRRFNAIVARGRQLGCAATDFVSTCDCPAADGFACVQATCTWNYLAG